LAAHQWHLETQKLADIKRDYLQIQSTLMAMTGQ
jgi:hypothetical protein